MGNVAIPNIGLLTWACHDITAARYQLYSRIQIGSLGYVRSGFNPSGAAEAFHWADQRWRDRGRARVSYARTSQKQRLTARHLNISRIVPPVNHIRCRARCPRSTTPAGVKKLVLSIPSTNPFSSIMPPVAIAVFGRGLLTPVQVPIDACTKNVVAERWGHFVQYAVRARVSAVGEEFVAKHKRARWVQGLICLIPEEHISSAQQGSMHSAALAAALRGAYGNWRGPDSTNLRAKRQLCVTWVTGGSS